MMSRKQALEQGFTIDDGQNPIAYKGPRFNPLEWRMVPTEREEELQARIDALMLEYCPDEMTPEQLANWAAHQEVSK